MAKRTSSSTKQATPAKGATTAPTTSNNKQERRWAVPSKRAKGYAEERKAKKHNHGPKQGKELTDYEAGIRSGYLQCQSDHAGVYKFKKALAEGKTKQEAAAISRMRGNGKK